MGDVLGGVEPTALKDELKVKVGETRDKKTPGCLASVAGCMISHVLNWRICGKMRF